LSLFTRLRQRNIPLIGALKDILTQTLFYVSAINFILIAATAYGTTLGGPIQHSFPWLKFPVFMGFLFLVVITGMFIEYKYVYPSLYCFKNQQEYTHENLIRKDLEEIKRTLKDMKAELEKGSDTECQL
jgi:hypothetical protein